MTPQRVILSLSGCAIRRHRVFLLQHRQRDPQGRVGLLFLIWRQSMQNYAAVCLLLILCRFLSSSALRAWRSRHTRFWQLSREAVAAFSTTSWQDGTSGASRHALSKAMHLGALSVIRLVRSLTHLYSSFCVQNWRKGKSISARTKKSIILRTNIVIISSRYFSAVKLFLLDNYESKRYILAGEWRFPLVKKVLIRLWKLWKSHVVMERHLWITVLITYLIDR